MCQTSDNTTQLAWKVDGPLIKIGHPERLKSYDLRVYNIRDLLLNTQDRVASRTLTATESARDRTDDTDELGQSSGVSLGGVPGASVQEALVDRAEALRRLITSTVAPETWVAGSGIGGTRGQEEEEEFRDLWGAEDTYGADPWGGMPGGGVAEAGPMGPRGRAFFRGGSPGDIVIIQTAEVHAEIEELLKELRRAIAIQVNVETRFIEVGADFMEDVGFSLPEIARPRDIEGGEDGTDLNISVSTGSSRLPAVPYYTPGAGLHVDWQQVRGPWNIQGLFHLAQSRADHKTLSTPVITLMNAQRGHITVETTHNYVETYEVDADTGTLEPQIATIADSVLLDVRPVVSADQRYVFLELAPAVTQVTGFDTYTFQTGVTGDGEEGQSIVVENIIQLPEQIVQSFETTVCVPDRGILMVGGLARHEFQETERGVPVLNKIPFIKRIFGAEGKSVGRRSLLVLVRPTIIILEEEEKLAF